MSKPNQNHPKKGSIITVDPLRSLDDIKAISGFLESKPRDLLLFKMGINNGLRIGDLLRLHVGNVRGLKPGNKLMIREQKTKRSNILVVNKAVYKALQGYLGAVPLHDDDWLFQSRQRNREGFRGPLQVSTVNKLVKKWTRMFKIKGNFGTHTLRKTWGYQQRVRYGVAWELIAERFGHSSPAITKRYLGIHEDEIKETLMNEIG